MMSDLEIEILGIKKNSPMFIGVDTQKHHCRLAWGLKTWKLSKCQMVTGWLVLRSPSCSWNSYSDHKAGGHTELPLGQGEEGTAEQCKWPCSIIRYIRGEWREGSVSGGTHVEASQCLPQPESCTCLPPLSLEFCATWIIGHQDEFTCYLCN